MLLSALLQAITDIPGIEIARFNICPSITDIFASLYLMGLALRSFLYDKEGMGSYLCLNIRE